MRGSKWGREWGRGWGTGVYLAQKASNFQRGCKNGVGTRVGIRGPLVGSIKRRLAFLPPTPEGVVLTPLSCFPSFPAFLFSTTGKLSTRTLPPLFASLLRRVTLDFFLAFYTPRLPLSLQLWYEKSRWTAAATQIPHLNVSHSRNWFSFNFVRKKHFF